jgi:hypothetical protein
MAAEMVIERLIAAVEKLNLDRFPHVLRESAKLQFTKKRVGRILLWLRVPK